MTVIAATLDGRMPHPLTVERVRELSRQYRRAAAAEMTPAIKQYVASHALALAQLAERMARDVENGTNRRWRTKTSTSSE